MTTRLPFARAALPALAALTLAACAVGPDYQSPQLPEPEHFEQADTLDTIKGSGTEQSFWASFNDPVLSGLIQQALDNNQNIRISMARYDQANAVLRQDRFDQIPTVTASAQGERLRYSADQMPGYSSDARKTGSYDAGINASWELDLFGRVRRNVQSGRAEALASAADVSAMQIAIVSELANDYFELRGLQERLDVARQNADNQRQTLNIVSDRVDAGRGTELDTARARAQLETTLATIPDLLAQITATRYSVAILAGLPPEQAPAVLSQSAALPDLHRRIDPGTPGDLLRRRPDIAAAEQRLAAATARIGVATADLFPRFTLFGLLGSQAADVDDLFSNDAATGSIGLGVDWSFLDTGRVKARIAAADAAQAEQLASWHQTVLEALGETETAMVRYGHALEQDDHLQSAATDSAKASKLARIRYEGGAVDLLEVLDAERTQLSAEDALVQGRTHTATALVDLYRALAGSWDEPAVTVASR